MMWEIAKLGDISKNIQTGPFGSQLHQSDYSECGIPVVMPKDLVGGKISEESIARVDKTHVERLCRHKIEVGDILYSRRGDVGRCAHVTKKEEGWLCGTGCLRVTIDSEKADSRFVFFQLQHPDTVGWVEKHAVGATMLNLNTTILSSVPIRLPTLEIQKRIADILSAYDDLIENNQKQIKLLEEAAQRLYKEWFVDLRFPGHENTKIVDGVPEEWSKNPIQDFISYEIGGGWGEELQNEKSMIPAYVIRGTDIKGLVNGQLQSVPYRYHTAGSLETRKLRDGDIVFEVSGGSKTEGVARTVRIIDLMLKTWENSVICASFCKRIKPIPSFSQYLYDSFRWMRLNGKTQEYDKKSASSIVNYRWKDFLAQEKILKPDEETISRYNNIAGTIYTKIIVCSCQIEQAKMKRELLLPKLMNGEVEV